VSRRSTVNRSRIPNLFIIGAMKCGTTSLHNYLAGLRGVFMSEPKEPGFFVRELTWSKGRDWYLGLFAAAGDAEIVGESSTHYTKLPTYEGVAERIRTFNPEARFIYLMRDPLDRTISHYWHNLRDLRIARERRSMLRAVREDPQYLSYSDYAMQLEPYIALFGRDALYLETFEAFTLRPDRTLRAIVGWLGLDTDIPASLTQKKWNPKPSQLRKARGSGTLNRLRYNRFWGRLSPRVPRWMRSIGNRLAETPVDPNEEAAAAAIEYLRPPQLEQAQRLSALLGRQFPEWTTLYGSRPARSQR
jgi:Sulfotransferase family